MLAFYGDKAPSLQQHPFDVRIDVERWRPQKPDQRLAAFTGKINRERRRGRDRRNDRDSGSERFLDDFERNSSTYDQHMPIERQKAIEKSAADCLVDRI